MTVEELIERYRKFGSLKEEEIESEYPDSASRENEENMLMSVFEIIKGLNENELRKVVEAVSLNEMDMIASARLRKAADELYEYVELFDVA